MQENNIIYSKIMDLLMNTLTNSLKHIMFVHLTFYVCLLKLGGKMKFQTFLGILPPIEKDIISEYNRRR